jgi:hypothetical protein
MDVRNLVQTIERMVRKQQKNSCGYAGFGSNFYDFLMRSLLGFFQAVRMSDSKGKTIDHRKSKHSYQKSFDRRPILCANPSRNFAGGAGAIERHDCEYGREHRDVNAK